MNRPLPCLALLLLAACGTDPAPTPAATKDATVDTAADAKSDTSAAETAQPDTVADTAKPDAKADAKVDAKDVAGPAKDDLPAGATLLESGKPLKDKLDPTGDVDHYTFAGKKGELIVLYTDAQTQAAPFDKETVDLVLTLFGPDGKPYAWNDDPEPRTDNDSRLFTVLPADGNYLVRLEECATWLATAENAPKGAACAEPVDKTGTDYTLGLTVVDAKSPAALFDPEKGNDAASAAPVVTGTDANGAITVPLLWGFFKDVADVDVYAVKVPATVKIGADQRLYLNLSGFAHGPMGSGATNPVGSVWLASAATPTAMLAQSDFTQDAASLSVPVTAMGEYLLFVSNGGKTAGANDFYVLALGFSGGNPLEQAEPANDKPEGAEALKNAATKGLPRWYLDGDLPGAKDVDHVVLDVTAKTATAKLLVTCIAQLMGSGLRSLTMEVIGADGKVAASAKESASEALYAAQLAIPTDATKVVLRLSAVEQAPFVSSSHYRCGFVLAEPLK